ncbi:MAG: DNA mismatch repair protein MutS [Lentimicrobiaceae bacterium]|nr:DNA mismatch repair protein MutS [Lentimicrobiaceae bacterium]MCP4910263.1 DNA mismatch repair protein MutS [Bacteroidota bacterium]MBT3454420.1 DNA mismatch repair protein MutS [Lentimicrobiaceae bacterium]MBT3818733.1 DNA mismatch repair protein MutS [Lentimicrobiaceae bacterium]MBT4062341.1 DNA mismatch repair protein MutS [Lentimicrobiaceae bacterium]
MKQYNAIKAKYPDALLLFRVGDFYETFGEDAIKASSILGIVLTKRRNGAASFVELAGFPHHSLDTYLPKLVRAGNRVAICDQLEDPKLTKKIVKRGVTELVTPGVTLNDNVLEQKENNFLASIHLTSGVSGISLLDISTGEFYISEGNNEYIDKLLQSFSPSEVVIQRQNRKKFEELFGDKFHLAFFDDWVFSLEFANEILLKHFNTNSLKGFGIESINNGIIASGAALHYLLETHHDKLDHISNISRIDEGSYVWLDKFTIRNLEMIYPLTSEANTLLNILDHTDSPMGARLMRRWIALPLKDINNINERLNVVEYLMHEQEFSHKIQGHIKKVGDLERLVSKVATARVNPRELKQLQLSLYAVEDIKNTCSVKGNKEFGKISMNLNPCRELADSLSKQLTDEPPLLISKGNIIANGVNDELDELRNISSSAKDYLQKILEREIKRTNISSLKIGFNNVFGYYLEVTHTHKEKVPEDWHRKQTLTGSERYITEELKDLEDKILGAQEKIISLEQRLYDEVVQDAAKYVSTIQINSTVIAELDCLSSFSKVSLENNYSRPEIVEGYTIDIRNGRHPVIEFNLPPGESYIPNDVYLDSEKQQIIILTGPNMSGKSALLRQTALIILMGQMGCMVPAESAKYGFVDKVFTRVGASDNISSGESTFMVEMNETASILNNISNRSLILLDEIGRGTSTYDGISIAWSIAEFLHNHPAYRSKVLFATHYHELNDMSLTMKRIKNYHISIKEHGNKVIFLRKLTKGGSEHSFGIHVAEMAGMPKKVTSRAKQMLKILEKSHSERQNNVESKNLKKAVKRGIDENLQLSFIQLDDPLLNQIKNDILNTDVDTLTPVEALMKLNEIKKTLGS